MSASNVLYLIRNEFGVSDFIPVRGICGFLAALIPKWRFPRVRAAMYRLAGFNIARKVTLFGPLILRGHGRAWHKRLTISEGVCIAPNVELILDGECHIGKNVTLSPGVVIHTGTHQVGFGSRRCTPDVIGKAVSIGDGAWICLNALVLPGVTIGPGAVVSAGAVVSMDVEPHTMVAGNPAVVVGNLPFKNR